MFIKEHMQHYERARKWIVAPMLMLGRHDNLTGMEPRALFGADMVSLDLDGGDLRRDLTGDMSDCHERFATVFNLGTIEHIWDAHAAWTNAAKCLALGGRFITVSPVGGYENHGIHITGWPFILDFFRRNGFEVLSRWMTRQDGTEIPAITRGGGNQLLWAVARRDRRVERFSPPQHVFVDGKAQC